MMHAALFSIAASSGLQLDRVEVIADDPGTYLTDEVPLLAARPGGTLLRGVAQVQPVLGWGEHFTLGLSLSSITPGLEVSTGTDGLGLLVAMPTRLGLPSGALIAATWRRGPLWADIGMRAASGATWHAPQYSDLRVAPTVGIGWVPGGARD